MVLIRERRRNNLRETGFSDFAFAQGTALPTSARTSAKVSTLLCFGETYGFVLRLRL